MVLDLVIIRLAVTVECYGVSRTNDPRHFFPVIGAAVVAFRQETGAEWMAADPSRPRKIPASPPISNASAGWEGSR